VYRGQLDDNPVHLGRDLAPLHHGWHPRTIVKVW
jgi:hypothetical protein